MCEFLDRIFWNKRTITLTGISWARRDSLEKFTTDVLIMLCLSRSGYNPIQFRIFFMEAPGYLNDTCRGCLQIFPLTIMPASLLPPPRYRSCRRNSTPPSSPSPPARPLLYPSLLAYGIRPVVYGERFGVSGFLGGWRRRGSRYPFVSASVSARGLDWMLMEGGVGDGGEGIETSIQFHFHGICICLSIIQFRDGIVFLD